MQELASTAQELAGEAKDLAGAVASDADLADKVDQCSQDAANVFSSPQDLLTWRGGVPPPDVSARPSGGWRKRILGGEGLSRRSCLMRDPMVPC